MATAELASERQSDYLSQLTMAAARYANRTERREGNQSVLESRGVLYADTPERVEKRLARLGADWAMARAIERTQTQPASSAGSTLGLPPEGFTSDALGLERLIGRNNLTPVAFCRPDHHQRTRGWAWNRIHGLAIPVAHQQPRTA